MGSLRADQDGGLPIFGEGMTAAPTLLRLTAREPLRFELKIGGVATNAVIYTREEWESLPDAGRPEGQYSTDSRGVICFTGR